MELQKNSFGVGRLSAILRVCCVLAVLLLVTFSAHAVKFRLPLSSDTVTHYWYDNNANSGAIDDWRCGNETYDGHRGSDFSGGPRGRAIYAAAVGTLEYKIDGFGDGYRGSPDGGGFGNYVRLGHADNMKTYYAHMTAGSVTGRGVGSTIACGEQVGGVGTSGSSTGFHLHFEVRVGGVADDPYSGSCGGPLSYWVNQNGGTPTTTCEGATSTKTARNVDNPSGVATGTWATGTSSTDKLGADYRYKSTAPISEPFTWSTALNTTATWNVRAWWPQGANRSTTAPYIVSHGGGTTTVNKNQQVNGGSWQLLGSWSMGGTQTVKLSCWTTTGYIVVADGVRWD